MWNWDQLGEGVVDLVISSNKRRDIPLFLRNNDVIISRETVYFIAKRFFWYNDVLLFWLCLELA